LGSSNEARSGVHARRMFFALWPTEALREQIGLAVHPLLDSRNARPIPLLNLHITLAFLGSVSEGALADIVDAANQISAEPFHFTIDHLVTWRRSHIACLTIEPTPPLLAVLVERLRFSLLARKVEADRKEFKAHVTVARDWREEGLDQPIGPFVWSAEEFVLVESRAGRAGSEYTIIERWPLAQTAPA
jgi:RNA 2',3'-cyclic 3'-phosphodiesterase